MPAFSEDVLLPIVRADLRARRGPFYSHWVANDLAGADGSGYSLRAPIHLIHGADDELCPLNLPLLKTKKGPTSDLCAFARLSARMTRFSTANYTYSFV